MFKLFNSYKYFNIILMLINFNLIKFSPEAYLALTILIEILMVLVDYRYYPKGGRHLSALSVLHLMFYKNITLVALAANILQDILIQMNKKLRIITKTSFEEGNIYKNILDEDFIGPVVSSDIYLHCGKLVLTIMTMVIINFYIIYFDKNRRDARVEYSFLLALFLLFVFFFLAANDFFTAIISLAGASLCIYPFILLANGSKAGLEASTKYYILSTSSTLILLFGVIALLYSYDSIEFINIRLAGFEATHTYGGPLKFVFLSLFLIGFGFKISSFPVYTWTPEIYDGAPYPTVVMLATVMKFGTLLFLMRVFTSVFWYLTYIWAPMMQFMAIGSLVVGGFLAIRETKIARSIAYSSINQIGYILLGISCGTIQGLEVVFLYILVYYLTIILLFIAFFTWPLKNGNEPASYLTDLQGIGWREDTNLAAIHISILLFSLAGIPPLIGFFSKYYLLQATAIQGLYGLTFFTLIMSVLSAAYYLRIVKIMWFEPSRVSTDYLQLLFKFYNTQQDWPFFSKRLYTIWILYFLPFLYLWVVFPYLHVIALCCLFPDTWDSAINII